MKAAGIIFFLWMGITALPQPGWAVEALIRVGVLTKYDLSSAEVQGAALRVRVENGGAAQELSGGEAIWRLRARGNSVAVGGFSDFSRLEIKSAEGKVSISSGKVLFGRFSGRLQVEARAGILRFVEVVPLESYTGTVLVGEIPEDFPVEAQKAQAVLIRSYALAHRGRHAQEGFDFCDLTHCQVYGGLAPVSALREEALRATRSLVMTYFGKPIEALFHSTCGGHTSPNQRVFGGRPLPYLQGVDDGDYCAASPHRVWESRIPLKKISAILSEDPRFLASIPLSGLEPAEREAQGRVFGLKLNGPRPEEISAMDFLSLMGKALGWNQVKSNWFDMEIQDGTVSFHGRGLGHGVGMCQWGARGMALSGQRFDEILRHYFPGGRLERIP